jgi:hypothetical protein
LSLGARGRAPLLPGAGMTAKAVAGAARRLARGRSLVAALVVPRAASESLLDAAATVPWAQPRAAVAARSFSSATTGGETHALPHCPACKTALSPHWPQGVLNAAVRACGATHACGGAYNGGLLRWRCALDLRC